MNTKKIRKILALSLAVCTLLIGCSKGEPASTSSIVPATPAENNRKIDETTISLYQFDDKAYQGEKATIETSLGTIEMAFFPQDAPKAVENFLSLAKSGYYNGLRFTKSLENYMVQCGDPEDGTGGRSIWDKPFLKESSLNLWNFRGAVGMAATSDDGNTSQFYIITSNSVPEGTLKQMEEAGFPSKVINKYKEVGGTPWLDGKQTVFGYVINGMDVIDKINAIKTDSNNIPTEDIIIQSIKFN